MPKEPMYILRGLDAEGNEVFYTGRAGAGFVNPVRGASFGYVSKTIAQSKAVNFNRMTQVHGIHFVVVPYTQEVANA